VSPRLQLIYVGGGKESSTFGGEPSIEVKKAQFGSGRRNNSRIARNQTPGGIHLKMFERVQLIRPAQVGPPWMEGAEHAMQTEAKRKETIRPRKTRKTRNLGGANPANPKVKTKDCVHARERTPSSFKVHEVRKKEKI